MWYLNVVNLKIKFKFSPNRNFDTQDNHAQPSFSFPFALSSFSKKKSLTSSCGFLLI